MEQRYRRLEDANKSKPSKTCGEKLRKKMIELKEYNERY